MNKKKNDDSYIANIEHKYCDDEDLNNKPEKDINRYIKDKFVTHLVADIPEHDPDVDNNEDFNEDKIKEVSG